MNTTRRAAWPATAACAVLITAASGCGSTHTTPTAAPTHTTRRPTRTAGTAPATQPARTALVSKDQLLAALPGQSDIPGLPMTPHPDTMLLTPADLVATTPTDCQPIAETMNYQPKHPRHAQVWATAAGDTTAPAPDLITLTSHTRHDATAWVDDLTTALTRCHRFTAMSFAGWLKDFTVRALPAPHSGDAATAYYLTDSADPSKGTAITVVRTGTVLAFYQSTEKNDHPQAVAAGTATAIDHRIQHATTSN